VRTVLVVAAVLCGYSAAAEDSLSIDGNGLAIQAVEVLSGAARVSVEEGVIPDTVFIRVVIGDVTFLVQRLGDSELRDKEIALDEAVVIATHDLKSIALTSADGSLALHFALIDTPEEARIRVASRTSQPRAALEEEAFGISRLTRAPFEPRPPIELGKGAGPMFPIGCDPNFPCETGGYPANYCQISCLGGSCFASCYGPFGTACCSCQPYMEDEVPCCVCLPI
jgi:hypothetical protein